MPFTFSHPAIILPLKRWVHKLSLSALIIGSTTPDFEYFINMKMKGSWGHSWEGLLWFNLPIGLVLYLLWHSAVKKPLIENLPVPIKARMQPDYHFDGVAWLKQRWLWVILSLLMGSASHILWDGFTHAHTWATPYLPFLQYYWSILGYDVAAYSLFQHGSTLLGGLILMGVLIKQPQYPISNHTKPAFWGWWALLTLIIAGVRLIWLDCPWFYGDLVATAIAAGMWALIITCLVFINRK